MDVRVMGACISRKGEHLIMGWRRGVRRMVEMGWCRAAEGRGGGREANEREPGRRDIFLAAQ